MATINKVKIPSLKIKEAQAYDDSHLNFMGGTSFDINNPILRLKCMAASCFFGEPMYYKDIKDSKKCKELSRDARSPLTIEQQKYLNEMLNAIDNYEWRNLTPAESMEKAIDAALEFSPLETLQIAVELRQLDNIRTTPQVIMVRAANHLNVKGTGWIREFAPKIISRLDEPAVQMAYQLSAFGKPIPNSLKRAWKDVLEKANSYKLAKYRMENRQVKTVDVINMVHAKSESVNLLSRGELKLGGENKTWESIISAGGTWEEAIPVMGHMALLRNIRNFIEKNIDTDLWLPIFLKTAPEGKQLPFRYLMAYNMVKDKASAKILDAIEEALELSIDNLPILKGKSLILADNSGSATGTSISSMSEMRVAEIGNLMGVLTGKRCDEATLGLFGDNIEYMNIRKKCSILEQTKEATEIGSHIGPGTENGVWLALDAAIKNKIHYDNIFVYSDMQVGHGGCYGFDRHEYSNYQWNGTKNIDVAKLVKEYRNKVNSKVNVFLCQIAGAEDTIIPELYERTYILGGWSDQVLHFASKINEIMG